MYNDYVWLFQLGVSLGAQGGNSMKKMDKEVKLALIGLLMSFVTAAKDIVVAYINNDTDTQDKQ